MKKILIVAFGLAFGLAAHAADPVAGKEKSKACAACHGAGGVSAETAHGANAPSPSDFPKLAGQYNDYLVRALNDYKLGVRKNPIMAGMVANLSKEDIADLAAYFSSQQALSTKY
jgi:cytochrome c553